MFVEVSQLRVQYASRPQPAVADVTFGLAAGDIGVLIGPSGCGKTTLLRAVAGLEPVTAGEIRIAGEVVGSASVHMAAERRRIGMVFQDYALFPHLDVGANVAFGLHGLPKSQRAARVAEVLELVGLPGIERRFPHELSGGQQQRVALARALAPKPRLLLLDEPFSNLDVDLRERLAHEIRGILKAAQATALFVTHDQLEAFAIGDVIGVMHEGHLHQWDDAYTLYHRPATHFVAGECEVLLRADDIVHDDDAPVKAQILRKAFRGSEFLYTLQLKTGETVLAHVPSHHDHKIGEWIGIRAEVDHVVTFNRSCPLDGRGLCQMPCELAAEAPAPARVQG
jgi:iron(III) transport system ATP-binding protein